MKGTTSQRKFPTCDSLETCVCDYVSSIPKDWYNATNQKLPERWQQCIDLGGEYVKSTTLQLVASHQMEACKPAECKSLMNDLHNTFSPSYNPFKMQFWISMSKFGRKDQLFVQHNILWCFSLKHNVLTLYFHWSTQYLYLMTSTLNMECIPHKYWYLSSWLHHITSQVNVILHHRTCCALMKPRLILWY
jgi:hypothetical protein